MTPLLTKYDGAIRYEVFPDLDYHSSQDDFDPDYALEIQERIESGELTAYGVVKYKVCKCCCLWSETDSLWGMLHATPEQAFQEYFQCYCDEEDARGE